MVSLETFQKLLLLFTLAYQIQETLSHEESFNWDHYDVDRWANDFPDCDGFLQSPIHLRSSNSFQRQLPPLRFENYDIPLLGPLKLQNTGRTARMVIPATRNDRRATISGGNLNGRYEAIEVHFHWGSPAEKGSEHMIDNKRYAVEMHIVHKNAKFRTLREAGQYKNGFVVLSVMFKIVKNPDRYYPGLNKIFNKLPQIIESGSVARINGQLTVGQLIGDVKTNNFFTYKGSFTTPPCSEAVTWVIFSEPLPIASSHIFKFFQLLDPYGDYLVSNYRPVQSLNGRTVIFRSRHLFSDYSAYL